MRIAFASITVQLLQIIGLVLAGGILLLWVCWKMWTELHPEGVRAAFATWRGKRSGTVPAHAGHGAHGATEATAAPKTMRQATIQIVLADLSMSLDNVLAVAGAARDHPIALIFGLALSIALMGFAAVAVAKLLEKHKWIAYLGLVVVLYVALRMIAEGGGEVLHWASVV